MAGCVIIVHEPVLVYPQFQHLISHIVPQLSQNTEIIETGNSLAGWKKFFEVNFTNLKKTDEALSLLCGKPNGFYLVVKRLMFLL